MDPKDPKMDPKTRVTEMMSITQPGERTIFVLKRHPIGILGDYGICALVSVVTAALAFGAAPAVFTSAGTRQTILAGALVFVIVSAVCVTAAAIATKVYWSNVWTLTSDSLTQVNQYSLFNREASQLSLQDVEDVTSEQVGMLTQLFNYGVLSVETAGESGKFVFPFCPNPNHYAKEILAAREAFEQYTHKEESIYETAAPASQIRQTGQDENKKAPPVEPPITAVVNAAPAPAAASAAAKPEPDVVSYEVPDGPDGSV
jgi:uncharacterized membrane protein YdbT with pleckstrin-like domain